MNRNIYKAKRLTKRKKSIRKHLSGTKEAPRVSLARSNKHISAQAIDDVNKLTLVYADDKANKETKKVTKTVKASEVGKELGAKLKKLKIDKIVFDRSGYKYHGRVKALADGIREAGIKF